ncbi:NUDIX domain-containing protein [Candidatus Saccharibacteria bacterium]|nr:NUDIX domain-containing protein [Candidatus Saccharibacteria bacterium]
MELGETHIETLKREYKEETGLDVEPTRLLNVFSGFYHSKTKNHNRQSILIYYLVKIIGGEISTDGFDDEEKEYASVAEWKTLGEIKKMHHACSLDAKDHLVACVKQAMEEDKK